MDFITLSHFVHLACFSMFIMLTAFGRGQLWTFKKFFCFWNAIIHLRGTYVFTARLMTKESFGRRLHLLYAAISFFLSELSGIYLTFKRFFDRRQIFFFLSSSSFHRKHRRATLPLIICHIRYEVTSCTRIVYCKIDEIYPLASPTICIDDYFGSEEVGYEG